MTKQKEQVTIDLKEYLYLLMRDEELTNLENKGVDNWEGYGRSEEDYDDCEKEYEEYLLNNK